MSEEHEGEDLVARAVRASAGCETRAGGQRCKLWNGDHCAGETYHCEDCGEFMGPCRVVECLQGVKRCATCHCPVDKVSPSDAEFNAETQIPEFPDTDTDAESADQREHEYSRDTANAGARGPADPPESSGSGGSVAALPPWESWPIPVQRRMRAARAARPLSPGQLVQLGALVREGRRMRGQPPVSVVAENSGTGRGYVLAGGRLQGGRRETLERAAGPALDAIGAILGAERGATRESLERLIRGPAASTVSGIFETLARARGAGGLRGVAGFEITDGPGVVRVRILWKWWTWLLLGLWNRRQRRRVRAAVEPVRPIGVQVEVR